MATSNRRQTFAEHYIGRQRKEPDEVKTARRWTTDDRDTPRNNDDDHDTDENADTFTTSRRTTYANTCVPAPRHRQSSARQQQVSIREENHGNPIQDHIHAYKTQLVDDLNAQMSLADDQITQYMDELSEDFESRLQVIDEAGGKFCVGIGEERVQIGTGEGEDETSRTEVSLAQVIGDLEEIMNQKSARLKVLTGEYTRVHQESVKLAITILGEEKLSLIESERSTTKTTTTSSHTTGEAEKGIPNQPIDVIAAKHANERFEEVYNNAEAGLGQLQNRLDELVAKNLEENKGALKAFQAGRKMKQGELSKLLSSWSLC